MLDHPDAGHRVEALAVELPIVHHPDLDPVAQAQLCRSAERDLGLRRRERDAQYARAMIGGGVDREASPAAAYVEYPLPRLQLELLADDLQLRLLRLLQSRCAVREECAAVRHTRIEEQREELRRQVVVVTHRPGVPPDAVTRSAWA